VANRQPQTPSMVSTGIFGSAGPGDLRNAHCESGKACEANHSSMVLIGRNALFANADVKARVAL
jgi:hypothetical protein